MSDQRKQLEQIYGIQFPESFFTFWEFATNSQHFSELEVSLTGPFDVLRAEGPPKKNPLWEARYYNDPPEFLTMATGHTDGLHWGYYIDDPQGLSFPVASYYSNDAFELSIQGETLFDAMRVHLERFYRDYLEYQKTDSENYESYVDKLNRLDLLRSEIQVYATGERKKVGAKYTRKYIDRELLASPPTRDGMGIIVPEGSYVPLNDDDPFQKWNYKPDKNDIQRDEARAMSLLAQGQPGAALKLGKDLWIFSQFRETSYALLDAAYAALNRELLRDWLKVAIAYRKDCDAR